MPVKRLSSPEAIALVARDPNLVHIDVRSVPEFEAGHAPSAYNIPLMHMGPGGMTPNPNFAAEVQAQFPAGTPLMVSCKAGGRSARAAAILEQLGYTDLSDHTGGWGGGNGDPGWVAAGGPTTTATLPGHAYDELKQG
jgi:rhodanese-related sulfurtransferase